MASGEKMGHYGGSSSRSLVWYFGETTSALPSDSVIHSNILAPTTGNTLDCEHLETCWHGLFMFCMISWTPRCPNIRCHRLKSLRRAKAHGPCAPDWVGLFGEYVTSRSFTVNLQANYIKLHSHHSQMSYFEILQCISGTYTDFLSQPWPTTIIHTSSLTANRQWNAFFNLLLCWHNWGYAMDWDVAKNRRKSWQQRRPTNKSSSF